MTLGHKSWSYLLQMSDIKFENEEELVHLKSLGKKARSETQEARLLLLRVEKKRIQKVLSSRRLYQNLNDEQREKRRKAQKKWEQNLDEDHLKERQQKSNASRRRTGGRQVTPLFLLPLLSPPLPGPP